MPHAARVVYVFIASPGDVPEERDAIEQLVLDWNRAGRSRQTGTVLMPVRWETDAVAKQGGDGQSQVNDQLLTDADIVVAVFHTRLGQPTPRAPSGTAEEIERARAAGIPTHVYISQAPIPRNHDTRQLKTLQAYERRLSAQGLLGSFAGIGELRDQVARALESDVHELGKDSAALVEDRPQLAGQLSTWVDDVVTGGLDDDAAARIALRSGRLARRQAGVVATDIRYDLTVYRSPVPDYWQYDLWMRYRYRLVQPVTVDLLATVIPYQMPSLTEPSPPFGVSRTNPDKRSWDFQFWPPLEDEHDWTHFRDGIQVQLTQGQSRNPGDVNDVALAPRSVPTGSREQLGHTGRITVDQTWDTLCLTMIGMPHPVSHPALHFFAGDACTGHWTFTAKSRGAGAPGLRVTTLAAPEIAGEREVAQAGMYAVRLDPTDSILFPDDAVVVSINERSPTARPAH